MPVETKEFIWLTNDLVFKYVFSHEEIIMNFLNFYLEYVASDLRILDAHTTPQKYVCKMIILNFMIVILIYALFY